MATVITQDNGKHVVRYRDPSGKQREKTFAKKGEAVRFSNTVEADKARGTYRDPKAGRVTVKQFLTEHLDGMSVQPGTMEKYRIILWKHVLPSLGGHRLDGLQRSHLQAWVKAQTADPHLGPSTVAHHVKVLSGWLNVAVLDGLLPSGNPCARVTVPRPPKRQVVPLTPQQVAAIIRETPERYRAMVLLTAATGMRQAEAFAVTTSRLNMLGRSLRVDRQVTSSTGCPAGIVERTKTDASTRTIPLPSEAVDAVALHLARFPVASVDAPIFTGNNGGVLRRGHFNEVWKATLRRAGIPDTREYGFHALRHYYASSLIAVGLNAKVVQSRLGHASITETFDTYGHLFPEAEDQTREAASAALSAVFAADAELLLTSASSRK